MLSLLYFCLADRVEKLTFRCAQ
uniref:Uncharacterized protein n=1 Tax=Anguilla anguilla TaxID=7936 RepID=A0A0E9VMK7_ANGAN